MANGTAAFLDAHFASLTQLSEARNVLESETARMAQQQHRVCGARLAAI